MIKSIVYAVMVCGWLLVVGCSAQILGREIAKPFEAISQNLEQGY